MTAGCGPDGAGERRRRWSRPSSRERVLAAGARRTAATSPSSSARSARASAWRSTSRGSSASSAAASAGAGRAGGRGETTYFAHVDGLGETDLERAADGGRRGAARRARASRRPLEAVEPPALQEIERRPGRGPGRAQGRAAARAATSAPAPPATRSPRSRRATRRAAAGSRSPTPRGCFAADDRTRVRLGVQVVARRDGTVETGFETLGGHRGFELVDGRRRRADRRAGGAAWR